MRVPAKCNASLSAAASLNNVINLLAPMNLFSCTFQQWLFRKSGGSGLALFFCLFSFSGFAQHQEVRTWLIESLQQEQRIESNVFPAGSFPSYRRYAWNGNTEKADINPFFTALVDFTLAGIQHDLSPDLQKKVQEIRNRCKQVYPKFINRNNRPTYNFWPTDTPRIFPNGGWLNLFNKSQSLPDDMDDTVMLLLAQQAPDSLAGVVHQLMKSFTNGQKKSINNTYSFLQDLPAYSTWFGKKMPVDFDVSVLANILYFVQSYQLPWNGADSASLQLIVRVLETEKYQDDPAFISPHYQRLPVILYHLSRLMACKPLPELERFKPRLVTITQDVLAKIENPMDAVLLHTALLRWGVYVAPKQLLTFSKWQQAITSGDFSFFIANMSSMLPASFKKSLGKAGVGTFYYTCTGYNYALVLENLVWQERFLKENKGVASTF